MGMLAAVPITAPHQKGTQLRNSELNYPVRFKYFNLFLRLHNSMNLARIQKLS